MADMGIEKELLSDRKCMCGAQMVKVGAGINCCTRKDHPHAWEGISGIHGPALKLAVLLRDQLLAARRQHGSTAQAEDFAKIVRGSNGQQVLFYKEDTADQSNTLHHVVTMDGVFADMKLSGLPDGAFEAALDKCDVAQADKVIAQMKELGL